MKTRGLLSVSLLMSFELLFQVLNNPILKFIKIYFQAIIIFLFTVESGKAILFLFLLDSSTHILDMMYHYGFYISFFEIVIKYFQNFQIYENLNAWDLFLFCLIFIPFTKITALYGARSTIKRLKIKERIGIH